MKLPTELDRTIRVFVSSTFRDMQAERDELVKRVFPQLRKLCEQRGVTWGEVDLRWGITDEQKAEGRVLPICLAEIVGCRPYFIGVLGERYGWVLDEIPAGLAEQEAWLTDARGRSVTELEILHGVLNDPEAAGHCFFYFRDPAALGRLPRGTRRADFEAEGPEHRQKLNALKDRIRNGGLPVHENFQSAADLGQLVLADMTEVIDRLFPAGQVTSSLDREATEHAAFARGRAQVYVGRAEDFRRLDAFADATGGPPLVILGESGTGKSALLANWVLKRRETHSDEMVLCHFVGAGPASTDWVQLLRRIMGELQRHFGIAREVPQRPSEVVREFPDWLRSTGGRRVLLVLDALNQLEDRDRAHELGWLPETFPENVCAIVSTLPGRCFDEVQRRGWATHEVRPLDTPERERLCVAYLRQYAKTLAGAPLARIVAAPQTANALFLRALLDELRVFGSFERLERQIDGYLQAKDPEELFDRVLARCEADCDRERAGLVRDSLRLVWAARRGLAEAELLELLGKPGQPLPRIYWSNLALTIDSALVSRSGLLDFSHDYFRHAVERRYLPRASQKRAAHRQLANYFERREFGRLVSRRRWGGPYWLWLAMFLTLVCGLGWWTRETYRGPLPTQSEVGRVFAAVLPSAGLLVVLAALLPLLAGWGATVALSRTQRSWWRIRRATWPRLEATELVEGTSNARARGELPWQLVRAEEWWRLYDILARPDFLRRAGAASLPEVADLWKRAESGTAGRLAGLWARTADLQRVHRDIFGGRPIDAYRPVLDTPGDADHTAAIAALLLECGYPRESLLLSDRLARSRERRGDVSALAGALLHHADGLDRQGLTVAELGVLRNLEGLLRGTGNPALLARCLYAQAAIFESRHETKLALDRLDEADRMNPAGPTDLDRLRGRVVRASCLADAGEVDEALRLLRDTELTLLDGGGGPADLLAVLSRRYRILAAAERAEEATETEKRVCRLCTESGIDPTPHLEPVPPYRKLADLQVAATAWGQQRNHKFRLFALVEAVRTLAFDARFPLAARPTLTEAEVLAKRLRDSTFTSELKELREIIEKDKVGHGRDVVELACPRTAGPNLTACAFAVGAFVALFAFLTSFASGGVGAVFAIAWFGIACLCFAAGSRRLHGLAIRPSILATPAGLLVKGWGLSAGAGGFALFAPFALLRPIRRVEFRSVLWEALVSVDWKNNYFSGPTLILQLEGEQIVVGNYFYRQPQLLHETILTGRRQWEHAARLQRRRTPRALPQTPARRSYLPDIGTLAFILSLVLAIANKGLQGESLSLDTRFFLALATGYTGASAAALGLLALLGYGRRNGTLRTGFAAVGILICFIYIQAGAAWVLRVHLATTFKSSGIAFAAKGDPGAAAARFTRAIGLNPTDPELYNHRGLALQSLGDLAGALSDFTDAVRLDANFANARSNRGYLRLQRGEIDKAVEDLNEAIHLDPKSPAAYKLSGAIHSVKRDHRAALVDFDRSLQLDPKQRQVLENRGEAHYALGEYERAAADFGQCIQLAPEHPDAYLKRAAAFFRTGDYAGAVRDFTEHLRFKPSAAAAVLPRRGNAWRLQKDYAKAIADFNAALNLEPENAATYNFRGAALSEKGENQAAVADFDRSLQLDSKQHHVFRNRGEARFALRDYKGAAADFGQCIQLAPDDAEVYLKRANCLRSDGRYKESIADYTAAIGKGIKNAPTLNNRGIAFLETGDTNRAIADFTEAIRLDAGLAVAYLNRGICLTRKNELATAVEDFDHYIRLKPGEASGFRERGTTLIRLGRWRPAADDFAAALKLDPRTDDGVVRICLLLKLDDQKGYREACTDLLRRFGAIDDAATAQYVTHCASLAAGAVAQPRLVVSLAEKNLPRVKIDRAAYLRWYGAALYRAGDCKEAIRQLDIAVAAQPKTGAETIDCLFLAMAHAQAGNEKEAKSWFAKASQRIDAVRNAKRVPETAAAWATQFQDDLLLAEASTLLSPKP